MSWLQTVEMTRIFVNNLKGKCSWLYAGQEVLTAPMEVKIHLFKSFCCLIHGCVWRHSYNSIRKLTVSYSDTADTFKLCINVPRYMSSSLAFAMNTTDHINVVFPKSAYSLMSRVTTSPNSIVTAIVNSDAYQQSPLMITWNSILYV